MNLDQWLLIAAKVGAIGVLFGLGAIGISAGSYKIIKGFTTHFRCWHLMIAILGKRQRNKVFMSFFREIYNENPETIGQIWEDIIKYPTYRAPELHEMKGGKP